MRSQPMLLHARNRIVPILTGPPILAFLPALTLGAFWLGGEESLVLTALGLPLFFAFAGAFGKWPAHNAHTSARTPGLVSRDVFFDAADRILAVSENGMVHSACYIIELEDHGAIVGRFGPEASRSVIERTGERLVSALRDKDIAARLDENRFGVLISPVPHLDLEVSIQLAGRLQAALEEPIAMNGSAVYLSCTIGFCQRQRAPGDSARDWIEAAETALTDAQQVGASSIRAFSPGMRRAARTRQGLRDEVSSALENGQIQPWYQPQISTDTGSVTGFEALARWTHPTRGVLLPDVFLPVVEECGLLERLGQVMQYHAFTALKAWDSAGTPVPRVGVNFAADELRNPGLVDRIKWDLDRFGLTPDRLNVEILETVFTDTSDDMICHNIRALGEMGCRIDLDDFGTGHASISAIRRFPVTRIKIDQSFVTKADRDPEQQRLVSAVLTMAERLELETLAEGVETVGEHALLAQLGCAYVQGFGIGKPMPFDQTLDWIAAHQAKLSDAPKIERGTG